MFTPKNGSQVSRDSRKVEVMALTAALFFIAFGVGLIADGKRLYAHQLQLSERVNYKATQDPYQ